MSTDDNKVIVRRFLEALDKKSFEALKAVGWRFPGGAGTTPSFTSTPSQSAFA